MMAQGWPLAHQEMITEETNPAQSLFTNSQEAHGTNLVARSQAFQEDEQAHL
ncbi:hypothetical protein RS9916_36817 [Synechococcus sp. RS9916]|nr:hypothetical protein RS9916_36817 [Synechococcus sp. RS9916]